MSELASEPSAVSELASEPSALSAGATPLRVGVVGLGWAGQTHIDSYERIPGVEVVGIAGLEPDRLTSIGNAHGIPHRFTDVEELLALSELDAVSICTSNDQHAPIAIAALESGRHVLSEKPLARNATEGETMVRAAIRAGRVLEVAFNRRYRGDVSTLRAHIVAGGLGRVYHAKAFWMRRNGIPGMGSWFTNAEVAGGGPLVDLGVHMLDMALYLLGEPKVLAASATTFAELGPRGRGGAPAAIRHGNSPFEVEDLATAFLRLADGASLTLDASWATYTRPGDRFGATLFGTEGGAEIESVNYAGENTLTIFTDVAGVPAEVRPEVRPGDGHAGVIRDFVATIRCGRWVDHVGQEGLTRARIIDACYRSAAAGHEVEIGDPSVGG